MSPAPERPARTLAAFRGLETAEAYLEFFGIRYDREALAACRLVVLRRFSRELAELEARVPAPGEEERLALYEAALRRAYTAARWAEPGEGPLVALGGRVPGAGCGGCGGGSGCGA